MNFFRFFSKRIIIFIFLLLLFIAVYIFLDINKRDVFEEIEISGCFTKVEKIVHGDSMEPMFLNEQEIILLENYYQCSNPVKEGDVIAYNYGGNDNPLIKIVKATDQDEVEIVNNKLRVNGEILKNLGEEEYIFNEKEIKMLSLYVKNGRIPENSFLIFGNNVQDSTDSRRFGAVSAVDFLGKFLIQ